MIIISSRAAAGCRRHGNGNNLCKLPLAAHDLSSYLAPSLEQIQDEIQQKRRLHQINATSSKSTQLVDGLAASSIGLNPRQNTRHAPTVYHEHYSCPNWPTQHTFPMSKFEQTAHSLLTDPDDLLQQNDSNDDRPLISSVDDFYRPLEVINFPLSFMTPPIQSDYLNKFLSGTLTKEECRQIGFREQTSRPELIERTVLEVAGTVLTAQLALRYGLACNVAGGTHHAEANKGKGFTILNDLAVASRLMTWSEDDDHDDWDTDDDNNNSIKLLSKLYRGDQRVERVLVVDCDVHQGDGTATFHYQGNLLHDKLFTLDLHAENNWPFEKETPTYDVPLPDGCGDEEYLSALSISLERALNEVQPQLVLYNAGVDPFHADKLGRLSLSWRGLQQRDLTVIQTCVERGLPIACVVGGGYSKDVREVAQRHALVHRICAKVWRDNEMWTRCRDWSRSEF
jgi:acetoin utilization deacetylase AcuC-like enzyme